MYVCLFVFPCVCMACILRILLCIKRNSKQKIIKILYGIVLLALLIIIQRLS